MGFQNFWGQVRLHGDRGMKGYSLGFERVVLQPTGPGNVFGGFRISGGRYTLSSWDWGMKGSHLGFERVVLQPTGSGNGFWGFRISVGFEDLRISN